MGRFEDYRFLILFAWSTYLFLSPYTKVEESFNTQAIHDMLYYGTNISEYDHNEFPGVVPRTFFGSLVITCIAYPAFLWAKFTTLNSKFAMLVICRFCLGLLVFFCMNNFQNSVRRNFSKNVDIWFTLISISQFHFNFYATRFLPNTFALALVLQVYAYLLNNAMKKAVCVAVFATAVFRSELVILFGPLFIIKIFVDRTIGLMKALLYGISAFVISLAITVPIDSLFWGRWLWPEGEVLFYNTILNKSSDWGVSPFLWYFYSALPRLFMFSLLFSFIGLLTLLNKTINRLMLCSLVFILLYSNLPHKETRFIIYVVPLLNLCAAKTCSVMWFKFESKVSILMQLMAFGHLCINLLISCFFLYASMNNYPGGQALRTLNNDPILSNKVLNVYIDVYSAQTGISRFLHVHDQWRYDKSETLTSLEDFHCVVYGKSSETLIESWDLKHNDLSINATSFQIDSFDHVHYEFFPYFPFILIEWIFKPTVFVRCVL